MSLSVYGGPADGQAFACRRAPMLLRVVRRKRTWDCLDLLGDEPKPDERIFLYEQTRNRGGAFICGGPGGGYFASASYRFIVACGGALDATVRDCQSWRRFVAAYFGVTLDPSGQRIADVLPIRAPNVSGEAGR